MNYKYFFEDWYKNEFLNSSYADKMENTVEGSPWHREENVLVHTNMVLAYYVKFINKSIWDKKDFMGAISLAFHDTGKPKAETIKEKANGDTYHSYKGHERISGRIWIDYICTNKNKFDFLTEMDIYNIWVMIANHLIFSSHTLGSLKYHLQNEGLFEVFKILVKADQYGRIQDEREKCIKEVDDYIVTLDDLDTSKFNNKVFNKNVMLLCGPTGVGKSTYVSNLKVSYAYHSMDQLRLDWYSSDYTQAFQMSKDDKEFGSKVAKHYYELIKNSDTDWIIVDNTNVTKTLRRKYVNVNNIYTKAVIFLTSFKTNADQLKNRKDKYIPFNVLNGMYYNFNPPLIGDVTDIEIVIRYD